MNLPNLEEYLGELETQATNRYYSLDLFDSPHIVLRPNGKGTYSEDEMPIIYGDYAHDDNYFWFVPRMQFPKSLKTNTYSDSYRAHMNAWASAAALADYLLEHSWRFEED